MVRPLSEVIQEKESIKEVMQQTVKSEIDIFRKKIHEVVEFCEESCLFQDFGPQIDVFSKEFINSYILPTLSSEKVKIEKKRQLEIFKKIKEKALSEQKSEEEDYV